MSVRYTLLFLLLPLSPRAQVDTARSPYGTYYFDGEDVVFEFNRRAYAQALHQADSTAVDFADLDVLEVAVTGSFNQWSREGWKMEQIDADRFRLRKPLREFKDAPDWQFKFLITANRWAKTPDSLGRLEGALGWYDVKNPNAPTPALSDTGNVVFRLEGYPNSREVFLAGNFNNWEERKLRMQRVDGGWEIHLTLAPGIYEYKFIVDGRWMEDPLNPEKRRNQYDTFNSVLRVDMPVRFELEGFQDAREVFLAGTFNDWNDKSLRMRRTEYGWKTELRLTGGKHLYKFIVDGKWMTDPRNPREETDLQGNVNSIIFVH